jgi:hypothetical protein
MGRLLDLSTEWLRRLAVAGWFPKATADGYQIAPTVQGYIKSLKDENSRASKSASVSRLQDAKTQEVAIRIAERNRELIPVEDAEAALDHLLATVRAELSGLPARITRDLPLRRSIEQEVNGSLARMADALDASGASARTGRDVSAAVADPGSGRMGKAEPELPAVERPSGAARTKPDALRDPGGAGSGKRRIPTRGPGVRVTDGQDGHDARRDRA